jgi:hypothetical protein
MAVVCLVGVIGRRMAVQALRVLQHGDYPREHGSGVLGLDSVLSFAALIDREGNRECAHENR